MTKQQFDDSYSQSGRNEGGFSVVEMLIAIVVVAVGLISVVGISAYVSRTNSTSNTLSVLATAAQDQVERLRTAVWNNKVTDPALSVDPVTGIGGSLQTNANNYFRATKDSPAGELLIRWQVRQGETSNMRYVTINATQVDAPARLSDGFTVSTVIIKK